MLIVLVLSPAAVAGSDVPGSKDHPLLNRMPGYAITTYEQRDFDTHPIRNAKREDVTVEGRVTRIHYSVPPGATVPSRTQVLRNYEQAILKIGGTVLLGDDDGQSYLKVTKDGAELWIHVDAYTTDTYKLWIIEKKAMAQDVIANASAIAGDLARTGHAAVYGIYFDTNKAVVKPESQPAIAEIAKLMVNSPKLALYVVGHTDSVGSVEANLKLSEARAAAVVKELVDKHRVTPARLKPFGVSSLAPVASNDTDEGRAKNRRVELVKQ